MAKIIDVKDISEKLSLSCHQLSLPVDDKKVMILQLSSSCNYCKGMEKRERRRFEETFSKQYKKLSREEVLDTFRIPSKVLFSQLSQVVRCVGCRRSCENLFNTLKESGNPSMEPFFVTSNGTLTLLMDYPLKINILTNLFSSHETPLSTMLENIPKFKKSGRCVLHTIDGVKSKTGYTAWLYMWEEMSKECQESITHISCDELLITLDNYLRKHRFCHECKNKVHKAFNILVGSTNIDPNKEKGYVASLYNGITKCNTAYIKVKCETDFIANLIARAEPELQGRRERHAKTLEIAQEEVLTCLGLFLYERLQKINSKMKEEEQAYDILLHVGLETFKRNFEVAVEEKQGISKFEKLCEELQKEELLEKAKREKRKRKKNKKKSDDDDDESKENDFVYYEEERNCSDCDIIRSPVKTHSQITTVQQLPLQSLHEDIVSAKRNAREEWRVVGENRSVRKGSIDLDMSNCSESKKSNSEVYFHHSEHSSPQRFQCSTSIDSLASRCSQCSRDGGYCSAQCSSGSSRDSSEVACGDGFCSHIDDFDVSTNSEKRHDCIDNENNYLHTFRIQSRNSLSYTPLQEMLDDFSGDTDEIPEAEVKAWHDRSGSVNQKRAELRQTLKKRFQQLCYRKGIRNNPL